MSGGAAAPAAEVLRRQMAAAVEAVATRHGLSIRRVSHGVADGAHEFAFDLLEPPRKAVSEDDRLRFLRKAADHGLSPTDLGREFRTANAGFRVVGWHRSSTGAPVLAECVRSGILHCFPVSQVTAAIEAGRARQGQAAAATESPDREA